MEPKQVIVMRKDLNMRKGKMVAQGAHASMAVLLDMMGPPYEHERDIYIDRVLSYPPGSPIDLWINGSFKKICVGVNSLKECTDIYDKAKELGIPCSLIKDKGLTEFNSPTITCCAIGPDYPEKIDDLTYHLKLL